MYEYELKINNKLVRRDSSKFGPNIKVKMIEDIISLTYEVKSYKMSIKKIDDWRDLKPKVDSRK